MFFFSCKILTSIKASWSLEGKEAIANTEVNMAEIMKHSPFTTQESINRKFEQLGPHGTLIVIFNLRRTEESQLELDFASNQTGIFFFYVFLFYVLLFLFFDGGEM